MATIESRIEQTVMASVPPTPGDLVRVHGPGLNSLAAPDRARRILGARWGNRMCLCAVLGVRRGGVLHVRLPTGEEAFVNPVHVIPDDPSSESEDEARSNTEDVEMDLGSEVESEDGERDDAETDGGESRRFVVERDADWETCSILYDQRTKENYSAPREGHALLIEGHIKDRIFPYFYSFLPIVELQEACSIMEAKGKAKYGDRFKLTMDLFLQWLGLWFRMCADRHRTRRSHWSSLASGGFAFSEVMSYETFENILHVLSLPQYADDALEKVCDVGEGPDKMRWIRRWVHACNFASRAAWEPGTYVTVDETMVFWTGLGEAHLTYMPRKPSPLGVMFKVCNDSVSGVLLHMELVEGAEVDRKKQWVSEFRATTACTLRLTKALHGSGRIVIGDSWFGSVRTVEELRDKGLYAIMCVKNGSAGYPKARLRAALKNRGDNAFYVVETIFNDGIERPVYAAGHMDKQPLMLVATTDTSLPGEPKVRWRRKLSQGQITRQQYRLPQPSMHATYRKHMNACDLFNKLSLQPRTLVDIWQTRRGWHRLFAATLCFIETNAYCAFNATNKGSKQLTKAQWYAGLSEALINNPLGNPVVPRQLVVDTVGHTLGHRTKRQARCFVCPLLDPPHKPACKTYWKCSCGRPVCGPMQKGANAQPRPCWETHLQKVHERDDKHMGNMNTRQGRRPTAD